MMNHTKVDMTLIPAGELKAVFDKKLEGKTRAKTIKGRIRAFKRANCELFGAYKKGLSLPTRQTKKGWLQDRAWQRNSRRGWQIANTWIADLCARIGGEGAMRTMCMHREEELMGHVLGMVAAAKAQRFTDDVVCAAIEALMSRIDNIYNRNVFGYNCCPVSHRLFERAGLFKKIGCFYRATLPE